MLNAHRGGDAPEVNNIPPSLSYRPADPAEPVLDISIGDALRAATSTWRTRTALIDGTSEEQTRRRRSLHCAAINRLRLPCAKAIAESMYALSVDQELPVRPAKRRLGGDRRWAATTDCWSGAQREAQDLRRRRRAGSSIAAAAKSA